jgi:adenine deaminase
MPREWKAERRGRSSAFAEINTRQPGFSIHDELRFLIESGLTPCEALAAGTVSASRVVNRMNGRDGFGTIAPGKWADLILLQENHLTAPQHVVMRGYQAMKPPLTHTFWPVIHPASALTRKATALAMSRGVPMRP